MGRRHQGLLAPPPPLIWSSTDESIRQAEFAYKLKPKLPAQFKAAETGGVPFAAILGEDEQAQGKVKIKEMGLPEGHPEKDGVMVELKNLVSEVQARIRKKDDEDGVESISAPTNDLIVADSEPAPRTGDDGV